MRFHLEQSFYQKLYQSKLTKRIILESLFGFLAMYLGCKIYPGALMPGQPIYLTTGVVFALYCIRGYRIAWGLLAGGTLAFYFSPETNSLILVSAKIFSAAFKTTQILFSAFLIRFLLDKFHMALLPMRKSKDIFAYFILAIAVPQLVFNLFMSPSIKLMVTALGHSVGLLTIANIFLIWSAHVPKLEPLPLSKKLLMLFLPIWTIMGALAYLLCFYLNTLPQSISYYYVFICCFILIYSFLFYIFITIINKLSNRYYNVIGMGSVALGVLFYAILHPEIFTQDHEWPIVYIQLTLICISGFWLKALSKS